MDWTDFLNDPELNTNSKYASPPDGAYLFKKILHDVLECLNAYKECVQIASALKAELPIDTRIWFAKWAPSVELWISEINLLWEQCEELPNTSLEWPNLIAKIGQIVAKAPVLKTDSEALALPSTGAAKQIVQIAIRATKKMDLLWRDVQAQEYKRLWTILRYGNFTEGI